MIAASESISITSIIKGIFSLIFVIFIGIPVILASIVLCMAMGVFFFSGALWLFSQETPQHFLVGIIMLCMAVIVFFAPSGAFFELAEL